MSERSTVIQRVIQLTYEIEQTYGYGKSYTFGSVKEGGYSQSEWELKERQDQRWLDTAREWTKTRNPLIAELQALVAEHRVEFTELADLVERQTWSATAVPERAWAEIRRVALGSGSETATHGPDFRNVTWYGTRYIFSPKQAACIRIFWEAWMEGNPWVADGTILQKAGVGDRQRLRDVFRNHNAWGSMIVQGPQQDLHGLQEPSKKL